MSIRISATRFFDILLAGGILVLLLYFSSQNTEARDIGLNLIALAFFGFIFYVLMKKAGF